jgi:hypothetical protein
MGIITLCGSLLMPLSLGALNTQYLSVRTQENFLFDSEYEAYIHVFSQVETKIGGHIRLKKYSSNVYLKIRKLHMNECGIS